MSYAPGFTPSTDFSDDESNQAAGRSTVKTVSLDTQLANISVSINALKANIEKIQRDDDRLKDFAVEPHALSEQTRAMLAVGGVPRGLWVALTAYAVGDIVQNGTIAYICHVSHASTGVFDQTKFISISGDGTAAFSAAQAQASADAAVTSKNASATSATASATSATASGVSATASGVSATNASTNAGIALGHANNASTSATNAALSFDQFDDRYLGAKSSDPTLDNDSNALLVGALYWNTTSSKFRGYTGTVWGDGVGVLNASMTTLSAITGQQATDLASLSAYSGTLLNDPDAPAWRATLAAAGLAVAQTFTAGQRGAVSVLVSVAAVITPDLAVSNNFSITLAVNNSLANPTNAVVGQSGIIAITQDATGSRTLAYGTSYKSPGGIATLPALSTAAGAIDHLAYYVETPTRIRLAIAKAVA